MLGIQNWFGILAILLHFSFSLETEVISDKEDICRLFANGAVLRMPGYCNKYIKCENFTSVFAGECTNGKNFTLSKKSCGSLDSWDKYCTTTPCSSKTYVGYKVDPKNCRAWWYCERQQWLGYGFCNDGMYFDENRGMCMYPSQTTCTAKFEFCNVAPPGTPFQDVENCDQYFVCSKKGVVTKNKCIEGTYYDVGSGTCIKKSLVNCDNHPKPDSACGSKKLAYRNRFVPDGASCRGYLYCRDLGSGKPDPSPAWNQCDLEYFFNNEKQACTPRQDIKCIEDRCDGRVNGREVSEKLGCQHYLECKNGATVKEVYCGDGLYFDETRQECTSQFKKYAACS